jgi:hypothetical protein
VDHDATRAAATVRVRGYRDDAETEAEDVARQFDVVDLIVNGATVKQVADHFLCSIATVRRDYAAGVEALRDRSIETTMALRDEITMRQRSLILANMPRARAGDRASALIVQGADALLASIWGLRSLRIEPPKRPRDPALAAAVEGYLEGLRDAASTTAT